MSVETQVMVDPRIGPPPPSLLAVPAYRHDDDGPWWPGSLLSWRWIDRRCGLWTGLVSYSRPDGLRYLHWIDATHLRPVDEDDIPASDP